MKSSLLLHCQPPAKLVSDYSDSERAQFVKEFEQIAQGYRRSSKIVVAGFLSLAFLFFIFFALGSNGFLPQGFVSLLVVLWIGLFFVFFLAALFLAIKYDPICPACRNGVDYALKVFCPECGGRKLVSGGLFKQARCLSCGKVFTRGKGRGYKIRFCTHCGIPLNNKGI
jgi:hypothetical protein